MAVDGKSVSNGEVITLVEGNTANFAVFLEGVNVTKKADFAVADSSVLDIRENGVMTPEGVGSSTVILNYIDSNGYVHTRTYTVNVKSATLDLIKNGVSEYSIVVPNTRYQEIKSYKTNSYNFFSKPGADMRVAAVELQYWFKEATGIQLNIVSDSGLTHTSGQKYISLGNTTLYNSCGAMLTAEEKAKISLDGSKIFNVDNTIYLIGGTDKGTCFAVYEWMNDLFGFDYFARDSWYIDDSIASESTYWTKNLKIEKFDTLIVPSVMQRGVSVSGQATATEALTGDSYTDSTMGISLESYGYVGYYNTRTYKWRMRYSDEIFFPIHAEIGNPDSTKADRHNTLEFMASSQTDYANGKKPSDSNWYWNAFGYFSSNVDVCYSAKGNQSSYNALVAHFANKILYSLQTYTEETHPSYNTVVICMEDGWKVTHCSCSGCTALYNTYGSWSAAGLRFTNDVANYLYSQLLIGDNAKYARDDFHLLYMAYGKEMSVAPNSFGINLNECVGVYYTPAEFNYYNDINSTVNATTKANAKAWSNLVKDKGGMALWTYSTNYLHYLYYYDSVSFFESKAYDFFANECGVYYWYNQNQSGQYGATSAFSNLQVYLDRNLMWDSSLNSEELIVKWFKNKFGGAWEEMFAIFNQMRYDFQGAVMPNATYDRTVSADAFCDYNVVSVGTMGTAAYNGNFSLYDNNLPFANANTAVYSVETAMDWLAMFDDAYAALEAQGLSGLEYEIVKKAIDTEWLSPAYVVLNRANASLNDSVSSTDGTKTVVLNNLKTQFKETVYNVRLVRYKEGSRIFDIYTFEENELFFKTLGYRGILTSLSDLLAMKGRYKSSLFGSYGDYVSMTTLASSGINIGNYIELSPNKSGVNYTIESYSFTFENNVGDNGKNILSTYRDNVFKANDSGIVTVVMTYKIDGVTYVAKADLKVNVA